MPRPSGITDVKSKSVQQRRDILVVEDDEKARRYLAALLEANGYRVVEVTSGDTAIQMVAETAPDLMVLNPEVAGLDGLEVIGRIREWSLIPIFVVSSNDAEQSKVEALDRGADDYLTKPFGAKELLARMRVALRHADRIADDAPSAFVHGELRVDFAQRRVQIDGEQIELTPTEYKLLITLVRNAGRVLTHRQILEEVWGPECVGRDHYVRVYMAHLRRKLEDDPAEPQYIKTETGVGYRLRTQD